MSTPHSDVNTQWESLPVVQWEEMHPFIVQRGTQYLVAMARNHCDSMCVDELPVGPDLT